MGWRSSLWPWSVLAVWLALVLFFLWVVVFRLTDMLAWLLAGAPPQ